jgi:hypothetical protein
MGFKSVRHHSADTQRSDGREPLDSVRIALDQIDQQRGLRIRLGAPLLHCLSQINFYVEHPELCLKVVYEDMKEVAYS